MSNKNYEKGRRKEYKVQKMLEDTGLKTIRASGSHGMFDVIAFGHGIIRMIQVKADCKIEPEELEIMELIKIPSGASKEIWTFTKGIREPVIREVKN